MEGIYKTGEEDLATIDSKKPLFIPDAACFNDETEKSKIQTVAIKDGNFLRMSSPISSLSSLNKRHRFSISTETSNDGKLNMRVISAAFFAYLSIIATGCILGWSSPTLPKILGYGEKIHVTKEEGAWLISLVNLGALLGLFLGGVVIDKIGRKWSVIIFASCDAVSWLLLASCESIYLLYTARLVAGCGVGGCNLAVPIYISEISPIPNRTTLGSMCMVSVNAGLLLVYSVGPFTSYLTSIMVCFVVPFLCIVTFLWMPESPVYLLNKGCRQEAYNSLQWFRGCGTDLSEEIRDMEISAEKMKHNKGNIQDLFKNRVYLRSLYYTCAYSFFKQTSGMNAIRFYAHSIFQAAGSQFSANASAIIVASMLLVTTTCSGLVSKSFGMRRMLLFSTSGNSLSIGVLAFYFFLKDDHYDVSPFSWLPLISLICVVVTHNFGLSIFLTVISSEIFPAHVKGVASSITLAVSWISIFLVTRYYDVINETFGQAFCFGIFCVSSGLAFLFILFQLPDTQGKSFEEIQDMLTKKRSKCNGKFWIL